jgi:hypothetical protein
MPDMLMAYCAAVELLLMNWCSLLIGGLWSSVVVAVMARSRGESPKEEEEGGLIFLCGGLSFPVFGHPSMTHAAGIGRPPLP